MFASRAGARSVLKLAIGAALTVGLVVGADGAAAAPTNPDSVTNPGSVAPSNPSDQQIQGAEAQKAALDQQVGQLSGQIAEAQARLDELNRAEELAEQDVAFAVQKYQDAVERSQQAAAAAGAASKQEAAVRVRFAQYMAAEYQDGDPAGMTGTLLTASDPSALLARSDYQAYAAERQSGAIDQMELASVRASNAKAKAARAKATAKAAKKRAEAAERAANDAVQAQESEEAGLQDTMNAKQADLVNARAEQARLYNSRAAYDQYQVQLKAYNEMLAYQRYLKQQAELRAQRAAAAKAAALRAEAKEKAERAAEARAEAKARAKAKREHKVYKPKPKKKRKTSSSNDTPQDAAAAPTGGGWTQAKGNAAVKRAKRYLGWTYAWAGGNRRGPTYGVCQSGDARNDCYVKGFDCSGLVLYAWGARWDHLAHNQYIQAGDYHPSSRSKLKPGDLLFFGSRGHGGRLHHVAIYVGKGKMIEAPQSNDVIKISSVYKYSDYYGATRPLT